MYNNVCIYVHQAIPILSLCFLHHPYIPSFLNRRILYFLVIYSFIVANIAPIENVKKKFRRVGNWNDRRMCACICAYGGKDIA